MQWDCTGAAAAVVVFFSFYSRLFSCPGSLSFVSPEFTVMIEFKDCYVRTYWLASFFPLLSSKIVCCLSLNFTTCIIIIMHQKGSISDSLQLSATDTCWWLLLLRWSAGPPEQRVCHFNCMTPGLAYYRYFFRKRIPTGFISNLEVTGVPETHWHMSCIAETCEPLECQVAIFPLFGRSITTVICLRGK